MKYSQLSPEAINNLQNIIRDAVINPSRVTRQKDDSLKAAGDVIGMIVFQILIPIVTSIVANSLYDSYKEKFGNLSKKEADSILKQCENQKISKSRVELSKEIENELRLLLEEYGKDSDILEEIVSQVDAFLRIRI